MRVAWGACRGTGAERAGNQQDVGGAGLRDNLAAIGAQRFKHGVGDGACFTVERDWRWNGTHYARTARDWLARFDENRDRIGEILASVYGVDAALWRRRWRLFYLATEGLFGHAAGKEWGVSHYLLRPAD